MNTQLHSFPALSARINTFSFFCHTSLLQTQIKWLWVFKAHTVTILDTDIHFFVPQTAYIMLHIHMFSITPHPDMSPLFSFSKLSSLIVGKTPSIKFCTRLTKHYWSQHITCVHTTSTHWVRASLMQVQIIMHTFLVLSGIKAVQLLVQKLSNKKH